MDDTIPKIIYKYRNWDDENHQKVLKENSLFCASANLFNDPFDCKIYKNHFLLDSNEKLNQYVEDSISEHKDWLIENNRNFDVEKANLKRKLQNISQYQLEHEKIEDSYTNDFLGVVSFSGRWDSILMWSHYANYHQGFCIGFNEFTLRNSRLFGKGGNVIYTKDFPVFDPLNNDLNAALFKPFYKSLEWKYEEEYRMMNIYFDMFPKKPNRIVTFQDEHIEEIILGLNISTKTKNEIIEIAKDRNFPVYQIEKVPFKFEISRRKIL
ncbi:DUF2971 domain-containing protein [Flavobacterium sp. 3HN19-14]|uniref:DUF2971 domain-containing protein n=1 Tax=Flavobacterium sp. 3HN19-14 TaxID=3448133 RepID=UPI003EDF3463